MIAGGIVDIDLVLLGRVDCEVDLSVCLEEKSL